MNLSELAKEYRANAALLELRVVQLNTLLPSVGVREEQRRIRRRIGALRSMMSDCRCAAYEMEHYHDQKGGSNT